MQDNNQQIFAFGKIRLGFDNWLRWVVPDADEDVSINTK